MEGKIGRRVVSCKLGSCKYLDNNTTSVNVTIAKKKVEG